MEQHREFTLMPYVTQSHEEIAPTLQNAQSCHCPQQAIRDIRAEVENRLLIYTPSVDLSYDNMQIYAHSTKSEVTLAIRSSLMINSAEFVIEQNVPSSSPSCQEGAELTAYCTTAVESTVTIQCENIAFTVECDPSNRTSKIALQFDKSLIAQKCFVICDKEELSLELRGQLHYHVRYFPENMFGEGNTASAAWPSLKGFYVPDL
ncbi:hypothetical protein COOONC_00339 [Cooperia oncophora]